MQFMTPTLVVLDSHEIAASIFIWKYANKIQYIYVKKGGNYQENCIITN